MAEAHTFLQQQGCINIGIPQGEPQGVSDEKLKAALFDLLEEADLDVRALQLKDDDTYAPFRLTRPSPRVCR